MTDDDVRMSRPRSFWLEDNKAFQAGKKAASDGVSREGNPYKQANKRNLWGRGYDSRKLEMDAAAGAEILVERRLL